jgi:hypothetical protein
MQAAEAACLGVRPLRQLPEALRAGLHTELLELLGGHLREVIEGGW